MNLSQPQNKVIKEEENYFTFKDKFNSEEFMLNSDSKKYGNNTKKIKSKFDLNKFEDRMKGIEYNNTQPSNKYVYNGPLNQNLNAKGAFIISPNSNANKYQGCKFNVNKYCITPYNGIGKNNRNSINEGNNYKYQKNNYQYEESTKAEYTPKRKYTDYSIPDENYEGKPSINPSLENFKSKYNFENNETTQPKKEEFYKNENYHKGSVSSTGNYTNKNINTKSNASKEKVNDYSYAPSHRKGKEKGKDSGNSKVIILDELVTGNEKRTTLMLKNIPNKYSLNNLIEEIDPAFWGKYDYINLPIDYDRKLNLGYAFINFTDPFHIVLFYQTYYGRKWNRYRSEKKLDLAYADKQGKKDVKSRDDQTYFAIEDRRFDFKNLTPKIEIPITFLDLFRKAYPNSVFTIEERPSYFRDKCFVVNSLGKRSLTFGYLE
ncbi:MAG: hypothetical protein MJ252_15805 [archaeon]|nr:hypothetical protein [archaeon]